MENKTDLALSQAHREKVRHIYGRMARVSDQLCSPALSMEMAWHYEQLQTCGAYWLVCPLSFFGGFLFER